MGSSPQLLSINYRLLKEVVIGRRVLLMMLMAGRQRANEIEIDWLLLVLSRSPTQHNTHHTTPHTTRWHNYHNGSMTNS